MQKETFFHSNNFKIQKKYDKIQDYLDQGDLEEALEETRLLLAQHSENPDVWCLEGIIRVALQEYQAAERSFDRACRLAPKNPGPALHKVRFLLTIQEHEEAARLAENAHQWAEDDEDKLHALFLLTQAHLGHASVLIEDWEKGLQEDAEEMARMGGISAGEEEEEPMPIEIEALLEKGLDVVEKAIALDPSHPEGWLMKAMYLTHLQRWESAVQSWKNAIEREPDNAFLWHELGQLYTQLEDYEQAKTAYLSLHQLEEGYNAEEGMEFGRHEFERVAIQAGQDLQDDLMNDWSVPLAISLSFEEFPDRERVAHAPLQQPFDPWTACHVDVESQHNSHLTLHVVLFQRNVERELKDDTMDNLYISLYELLHQVLLEAIRAVENEDVIEA